MKITLKKYFSEDEIIFITSGKNKKLVIEGFLKFQV